MSDEDLLLSNPVLAIEELVARIQQDPVSWAASVRALDRVVVLLAAEGIALPSERLRRWADQGLIRVDLAPRWWREDPGSASASRWRVLGTVVDRAGGTGYVVPLRVARSDAWSIAPQLPLCAERLVALSAAVCREIGVASLPERFAHRIDSVFPRPSIGRSMDVAGLVAVLLAGVDGPARGGDVCVLVEPNGGGLAPVEDALAKLAAFEREAGRGALLIRHEGCPSGGRRDGSFREVWVVEDLTGLADRALRAGWLTRFLAEVPLAADEAARIEARILHLVEVHDHRAVVGLAGRLLGAPWSKDVPGTLRVRARRAMLVSLRHLGRAREALDQARLLRDDTLALGDAASHDDLAHADLEQAAALFDPCRFEELLAVLEPWLERIERDGRLLAPDVRCAIWNTVARARIALRRDGWEALLVRSRALQEVTEPRSCVRTENYRIEGLLRAERLDEAERAIADNGGRTPVDDRFSPRMLAFYRADLARRRGELWHDGAIDAMGAAPEEPAHPLGLYQMAVARQRGRSAEEVARRLGIAASLFEADAVGLEDAGPLAVLIAVARLGSAEVRGAREEVDAACDALRVATRGGMLITLVAEVTATARGDGGAFGRLCEGMPWC